MQTPPWALKRADPGSSAVSFYNNTVSNSYMLARWTWTDSSGGFWDTRIRVTMDKEGERYWFYFIAIARCDTPSVPTIEVVRGCTPTWSSDWTPRIYFRWDRKNVRGKKNGKLNLCNCSRPKQVRFAKNVARAKKSLKTTLSVTSRRFKI